MNEAEQEAMKPARGPRPKAMKPVSGPNEELKKRRGERKSRGAVDHGFNKRLGLDDGKLDHANYRYRWVNDTPGNISSLVAREWEVCTPDDVGGQETERYAGRDNDGKAQKTVLLKKYKEWFDEDAQSALGLHRKNVADMMRGKSADQRAPDSDGSEYAAANNRVEDGVRSVRNPDFEA